MKVSQPNNIGFSLLRVTTEQFATIDENLNDNTSFGLEINLRFGVDKGQKLIASFSNFTFENKGKTFLIIEAGCHFEIKQDAWNEMINDSEDSLAVPQGFMAHLAMLTIGTTRGILHAKTEGSEFNKFLIPTVNVMELIKEDVTLTL